jgi:hypothetical protein
MSQTQYTLHRPKLVCTHIVFDPHVPSSVCIYVSQLKLKLKTELKNMVCWNSFVSFKVFVATNT